MGCGDKLRDKHAAQGSRAEHEVRKGMLSLLEALQAHSGSQVCSVRWSEALS